MTIGQLVAVDSLGGRPPVRAVARQSERRSRIVDVAMQAFAAGGYERTQIAEVARTAGVAKGAIAGYFGGKSGLFLTCYKVATHSFSRYLDAPREVLDAGFLEVLGYWLDRTPELIQERYVPYRVVLLGNYCSDLELRREITQYLLREDPYGTVELVNFGICRGEVRTDIDASIILALLNWLVDSFQDAIATEELDPGLFGLGLRSAEERARRISQFLELLRGAVEPKR
jgi:AcrR family transcriptional regulator